MVDEVKIIEQCQVSPPQGSLPSSINLPLSHLDLGWFYCPLKQIYCYNFPHSTQHFLQTSLPILKSSLSLTLQHFFPYCSKSILPPKPHTPHILYTQDPFLPLTPPPTILQDGTLVFPVMAIQITIFPNFGFTICLNTRHEVGDGKSFHHFLSFWSSLSKGNLQISFLPLPFHKREIIQDPKGLKQICLEKLWNPPPKTTQSNNSTNHLISSRNNLVRYGLNLTRHHLDNLKKWMDIKGQTIGLDMLHLSTFVATCSLLWVCMVKLKSQEKKNITDDSIEDEVTNNCPPENDMEDNYGFGFLMDMRGRFELSIPSTYFGNCLMLCDATLPKRKLVGENGICEAANVIGREISLSDPLNEVNKIEIKPENLIRVVDLSKFYVHENDFGWGNPVLRDVLNMNNSSDFLIMDSKDGDGGIDVGMILEKTQVKKFNSIFELQLKDVGVLE
ncbi:unnamed protein product [Vicia faba]|uniref:Anthocyanin acyltransferase n=1 Tax=Vicia faba TaxID=3906 RepID=A0AAV0Z0D3_VICFA|nr:unnamed protein product [Vicia faba]